MAWFLMLYSPTLKTSQPARFRLAANAEPDSLQGHLDAAQPGDFVTVPVVLEDEIEPMALRVQPHLYGAWAILNQDETLPGTRPQPGARGRQTPFAAALEQSLHESVRQAEEKRRLGQPGLEGQE